MSGSSAIASARRRRAGNTDVIEQQKGSVSQTSQSQVSVSQNINSAPNIELDGIKLTPLQILQQHELKINAIDETIENYLSKILEDRITLLIDKKVSEKLVNSNSNNNEDLKQIELKNIEQRITTINDANKNLNLELLNIKQRIDGKDNSLKSEDFEELKMIVIKTQTLGLETNNEVIKLKNQLAELNDKLDNIASCCNKDVGEDDEQFNMGDPSIQMLMKSLLNSDLQNIDDLMCEKLNISDDSNPDQRESIESEELEAYDNIINSDEQNNSKIEVITVSDTEEIEKQDIKKEICKELNSVTTDIENKESDNEKNLLQEE